MRLGHGLVHESTRPGPSLVRSARALPPPRLCPRRGGEEGWLLPGGVRERPALRLGGVGALRDDHLRGIACRVARDRQAQAGRAVFELADHRRGYQGRVVRVGRSCIVGRVHCGRREGRAIRVGGGGEDHHVPRGQATHVEREGRATLLIRARREVEGRRAAAVVVRADGEDRTGDLLADLQVVGDGRVVEGQDLLGGVTPVLVVALVVVGAQVDQVQGRARVGRHCVRPDRVRGSVR